ncbi:MAG TPA: hypothetical protein V6C65_11005 [Allocoleopsis sp.]
MSVAAKLLKVLVIAEFSDTTAESSDTTPQLVTLLPELSDATTRRL